MENQLKVRALVYHFHSFKLKDFVDQEILIFSTQTMLFFCSVNSERTCNSLARNRGKICLLCVTLDCYEPFSHRLYEHRRVLNEIKLH